ncbi:MAG: hypothetical protein ACRD8U_10580 [Pyrinomonadaceae bacterium]
MNDKQSKSDTMSLPPRLPQNQQELDRCIILLGNRKRVKLNTHARREPSGEIDRSLSDGERSGALETRITASVQRTTDKLK